MCLLFFVCLSRCLSRVERTQFESYEDEELQEQELRTLSSYYLDLRQVYSLIMLYPNNIYFKFACINFDGYLLSLLLSMSLNSRVSFIKSFE